VDTVARLAAVVLGTVFVVAAVAKIVAGATWVAQARELGAPTPVATALPGVELVVGALLIVGIGGPAPAVAAAVLLVVFTVAIARQLVDGRHPPCACFGSWSQRPIGEGHLVRNAALILVAVVALF
jgi:methylamine utilization protein MauE